MSPAQHVLMVRPRSFRCNEETIATNSFQNQGALDSQLSVAVANEFDLLRANLTACGVKVTTKQEPLGADTPDALYPNNWFAILPSGQAFVFPMLAQNRRREIQLPWIEPFARKSPVIDLRHWAQRGVFLEGTGSLVFDHKSLVGYACLSSRTQIPALEDFAARSGYRVVTFRAFDQSENETYHTNVMLAIGDGVAIVCGDSISDAVEREIVFRELRRSHREIVTITLAQMASFAGNMLQLQNEAGQRFWMCSESAYRSLTVEQKSVLERDGDLVPTPIPTIERFGGGSVRCMLGELF